MKKAAMAAMVFGAMVFWLPMLADPYMTPRLLIVAAAAGIALFAKSDRSTTLETPALCMVAAAVISCVFAHDKLYAIIGSYQFGMDSLLAFVCYFCVLLASARSGFSVCATSRMVVIASFPVSIYGIFQRFFADPLLWGGIHIGNRIASTQGGPIFLGAVLALVVICAVHHARKGDRTAAAALALAVTALWFTQTRGAILAAAIGSAFMFRWAWLAAIPALLLMPRFFNSAVSDMARIEVWKTAWRTFEGNPLTGYGIGNFYLAFRRYTDTTLVGIVKGATYVQSHAHNDILHVLATMGVIGLAAYAFLGYSVVRVALTHTEKKFLLGIIAAYAVLSFFNPVTTSAFMMLALIFGAASSKVEPVMKRRVLPALASIVVTLSIGRLTLADWHYAKGHKAPTKALQAYEFQEASRLNPWEMFYTCRRVDSLVSAIPYMELAQRRPAALAGRDLAAKAVKLHPFDSYAHELYGKQVLIGYIAGFRDVRPEDALAAFNKAQELAPTFEMIMWRRRNAAQAMGLMGEMMRASEDIAILHGAKVQGRKG